MLFRECVNTANLSFASFNFTYHDLHNTKSIREHHSKSFVRKVYRWREVSYLRCDGVVYTVLLVNQGIVFGFGILFRFLCLMHETIHSTMKIRVSALCLIARDKKEAIKRCKLSTKPSGYVSTLFFSPNPSHRFFVSFSSSQRRISMSSPLYIRGTIWSFFFWIESRCFVERFWSRQSLLPLGLSWALQSLFFRSNDIFRQRPRLKLLRSPETVCNV